MITIKRGSAPYRNSMRLCNQVRDFTSPVGLYGNWLVQYGGRLTIGWDIEFDNDEDATAFILKFS